MNVKRRNLTAAQLAIAAAEAWPLYEIGQGSRTDTSAQSGQEQTLAGVPNSDAAVWSRVGLQLPPQSVDTPLMVTAKLAIEGDEVEAVFDGRWWTVSYRGVSARALYLDYALAVVLDAIPTRERHRIAAQLVHSVGGSEAEAA